MTTYTIQDTPEIRAARLAAYRAGEYTMHAPPVPTSRWTEQDWMNFVRFNDPALRGWLEPK